MAKRKGKFGKNKMVDMENIECYGCQEYGNYKKNCPKLKKDNKKIK